MQSIGLNKFQSKRNDTLFPLILLAKFHFKIIRILYEPQWNLFYAMKKAYTFLTYRCNSNKHIIIITITNYEHRNSSHRITFALFFLFSIIDALTLHFLQKRTYTSYSLGLTLRKTITDALTKNTVSKLPTRLSMLRLLLHFL